MPLPIEALDAFRQDIPGLTQMLIEAEQNHKDKSDVS
jgi:hypothetical protein